MNRLVTFFVCSLIFVGCVPTYTLVKPNATAKVAKGALQVQPSIAWNKVPRTAFDIPQEENWTQNGPILDTITFIGGLKDGQAIAKQRAKDDQKVPVFRSNMTPQDLVSMVESYYRIKARSTIFETKSVTPTTFLGKPGIEFNFNYVTGNEVKRRGRALLAIVDNQLYFMSLDAAALHYFDATIDDFSGMARNASRI
jgi:hypothetical protein